MTAPQAATNGATDARSANLATVAAIYAAFGRGDVPAILDRLADDVSWDGDWADHFGQRVSMEHFQPRLGVAAVSEFFAYVAGCTLNEFQLVDLVGGDRQAVAQVTIDLSLPAGGRYRDEELHLWTFGPDGKVVALRHYIDSAKHLAAADGIDTTTR